MKATIPFLSKAIIYTNYRGSKFDLLDFDHLKDMYRGSGWTSIDVSLLCGWKQYHHLENLMNDWILSHKHKVDDNTPTVRVFQKNGLVYHVHVVDGMDQWSMIMIPLKLTPPQ